MKKILLIAFPLILAGCLTTPVSEFDRPIDFVKPISDGLYFIREVSSGGIWKVEGKSKSGWEKTADEVCQGNDYKSLLIQDSDQNFSGVGVSFVGGIPLAYGDSYSMPVVDGVVLCSSSSLTEEQSMQILIDEYYVIPTKP
ncbi:hypothetical protein G8764_21215 [Pseudomaricurvus alcaniphilus]|uniref:hypothetical protein n=1 Tax=Pseudomaricurvus alcaniphilus TaxID=1166482 RepID=UPI00140C5F56|nr:hypothetical protein [Pseudomaricurvus alcaniphilus]NHN39832.1 hypothetical protein [Pseudomaricurvus alcaniphilus]